MSQRITGRVNGEHYEVLSPAGEVLKRMTLDEARNDSKLKAAIERNGWERVDG
jgi:hypothetical protein